MAKKILKLNETLLMQPSYVFRYTNAIINKFGRKALFEEGRLKRYKELLVGAVVAQTFNETRNANFLVVSPDSDPPDFSLQQLVNNGPSEEYQGIEKMDFEVVDYTDYSKSIDEIIDKKLAKGYPDEYGLVVMYRHSTQKTLDFESLFSKYENEERWVLVVVRVTEKIDGTPLDTESWVVFSLTKPRFEKLLNPSLIDNPDFAMVQQIAGLGKKQPRVEEDFGLELPQ